MVFLVQCSTANLGNNDPTSKIRLAFTCNGNAILLIEPLIKSCPHVFPIQAKQETSECPSLMCNFVQYNFAHVESNQGGLYCLS